MAALVLAAVWLCATPSQSADWRPGVVFDQAGKDDGSFNTSIARGVERFSRETGVSVEEMPVNETASPQSVPEGLKQLIAGGANLLVSGSHDAPIIAALADRHPEVRFIVLDAAVDRPNVHAIVFREHEGAFLVGMLAALESRAGKVGYIGGMDVPVIRRIACGYIQGVHHARPDVVATLSVTGDTSAAFNDPAAGHRQAEEQLDQGVDVIFAAAGRTGLGVMNATRERKRFAIGVDTNQNDVHPGTVLTSMIKRIDIATYRALKSAYAGSWKPGVEVLGLADDGIGWAHDRHNAPMISDAMLDALDEAKEAIITGTLTVQDYTKDGRCNAWTNGQPPWRTGR